MAPQGNLLARAEAVVERAFRIVAENQATLARTRNAVQPLRDAAARQAGGSGVQAPTSRHDDRTA